MKRQHCNHILRAMGKAVGSECYGGSYFTERIQSTSCEEVGRILITMITVVFGSNVMGLNIQDEVYPG